MAPPRVTNMFSSTTHQTNHRSNGRDTTRSRNVAIEEEVIDVSSASDSMDIDSAQGSSQPPHSQEAEDYGVQKLLKTMKDDQRKRHSAHKLKIAQAFDKAHTAAQQNIASFFDGHETEAAHVFDARMALLQGLVAKKMALEAAMAEKLKGLRGAYLLHSQALQKVVEYRMAELHRGPSGAKASEDA